MLWNTPGSGQGAGNHSPWVARGVLSVLVYAVPSAFRSRLLPVSPESCKMGKSHELMSLTALEYSL